MKASEFAQQLRQTGEVALADKFGVQAKIGSLHTTLAESVTAALGPEAEIYAWAQTAAFDDSWRGQHVWWLVLERDLLELEVKMLPPKGEKTAARVSHVFHPLSEVSTSLTLTYRKGAGAHGEPTPFLRDADLVFVIYGDGEKDEDDATIVQRLLAKEPATQGVVRFHQALRAGIGRARGG